MKRASSIEALLKRAAADSSELRAAYEEALQDKHISDEVRLQIKSIFENLGSCFDYMAQDIFDSKCIGAKKPRRLYFLTCPLERYPRKKS